MTSHAATVPVLGPWSLSTSRTFWEGFTPAALPAQDRAPDEALDDAPDRLSTVFLAEAGWRPVGVVVEQVDGDARLGLTGEGDLEAAAAQVARFLALDVDGRGWAQVGARDPVVGAVQAEMPGLRPCGFFSPYEAAAWSVLSQRIRMAQAARLREDLTARHGVDGTFPPPQVLARLDADLPGRKAEYLRAVGEAALDGVLDGAALRAVEPETAIAAVQQVKGLGPFAAELVVLRGANAPDAAPRHEARLERIVADRYGADASLDAVSRAWRPYRTWAAFALRASSEGGR